MLQRGDDDKEHDCISYLEETSHFILTIYLNK